MTYKTFRADLLTLMHGFALTDRFSVDMFDPDLADPLRPPVLRREAREMNLILPDEGNVADSIRRSLPAAARHKWFGSMMSSQALTQSVFGALISYNRLDLLATVRAESGELAFEGVETAGESRLEKEVNWLGELEGRSTSIDTFFESAHGYRVAVECKFTERDFGACSRPGLDEDNEDLCDGSYTVQLARHERCSLAERGIAYWRYIPQIFHWSAEEDHAPCPARFTYQLVRNLLAALVHDGQVSFDRGHAVVIYDSRNPRFQAQGVARLAVDQVQEALGTERGRLRLVTWQDVIAAISGTEELAYLVSGLEEKYGLIATDESPVTETEGSESGSTPTERLRDAIQLARSVLLRVAGDGGVIDQLEQADDHHFEQLEPWKVEELIRHLDELTELAQTVRADDVGPILGR